MNRGQIINLINIILQTTIVAHRDFSSSHDKSPQEFWKKNVTYSLPAPRQFESQKVFPASQPGSQPASQELWLVLWKGVVRVAKQKHKHSNKPPRILLPSRASSLSLMVRMQNRAPRVIRMFPSRILGTGCTGRIGRFLNTSQTIPNIQSLLDPYSTIDESGLHQVS